MDEEMGKIGPSLRAAAKIGPYGVVGLDFATTKAFSLRLVWPDFRQQRHPPGQCEQALEMLFGKAEFRTRGELPNPGSYAHIFIFRRQDAAT
jgi:hypothetical protein